MYVGDTRDGSGYHHVLWEFVANSIDEHLAGHATTIHVSIEQDRAVVEDDGRGIPLEADATGESFLQSVLTKLHFGPTRDGHHPHVHIAPSLYGVGVAAVNAVCEELAVEVRRDGGVWRQRYERGVPVTPLERVEPTDRTGTRIAFRPDRSIFSGVVTFDHADIRRRLVELARFNTRLELRLNGERLHEPDGLAGWVHELATERHVHAEDVLLVRGTANDVRVEVALAWTDASDCAVRSFCGQNLTKDGGTHERGFWDAVVHAVSALHRSTHGGPRPRGVRPKIAPGLMAAVHVGLYDPQFGGPTLDRITSPEAADAVRAVLTPALRDHLTAHPALAQRLLARLAP